MALEKREPATFTSFYAPYGDHNSYDTTTKFQALRQLVEDWMKSLRKKATLPDDWIPQMRSKESLVPMKHSLI